MKVEGTNISMIRGDSEHILVSCVDENGNKINFEVGDKIYFTVKQTVATEQKLIQKVITEFVEGEALIEILPEDTKSLSFKAYLYDIQLTKQDGTVKTIIPPSQFIIEGEVTYE